MPPAATRTGRRGLRSRQKDVNDVDSPGTVSTMPELTAGTDSVAKQDDLNSSPVKSKSVKRTMTSGEKITYGSDCSSSPIKRKKMVVFSDDLVIPSSPNTKGSNTNGMSPLKSILKLENSTLSFGMSAPSTWAKEDDLESDKNPANPDFWQVGTIIQLKPGSPELSRLVAGIVNVLENENFPRKFEVYAALNHLCRVNSSETLYNVFIISPSERERKLVSKSPEKSFKTTNHIYSLCKYIQRDLTSLENELFEQAGPDTKIDPFCTRIINQALKLMAFLMTDQDLNNFISIEHSRWFYLHSCDMTIKPTLSKTLVLSYLVILKDCKFSNAKKKQMFDNPNNSKLENIPERILFSLLNMNGFSSSSLVVEKFVSLKNLIVNFPTMMAKNVNHWFMVLVVNLCDLNSPLFSKIATMGIQTLLESAKNFIDNKNVQFTVRKFLSTSLPHEVKSLSSDSKIIPSSQFIMEDSSESESKAGILAFDFVTSNLEELIRNGQYKSAMDIWVALTLLTGGNNSNGSGYETWPFLARWLKIHKLCFNQQDNFAKTIALTSWKGIIYNICHNDLDNLKKHNDYILIKNAGQQQQQQQIQQQSSPFQSSNLGESSTALLNLLKPKIKLLLHPLLNVTAVESQKDIIDILHNLFLSILYTLLNKNNTVTNNNSNVNANPNNANNIKFFHIYWDKIIQPILANFYFKKGYSNSYMNELGINIICKLLKSNEYNNSSSNFNDLMCLSNEPVSVSDISPLPPKWAFNKFDRIMQNLVLVFKLDNSLALDTKIGFFMTFLSNIKVITKKEIKPSNSTSDIIDNLPYILKVMFESNTLSFDQIYKVLIALNDTFGPANLIGKENSVNTTASNSVYFDIAIGIRTDEELSVQESYELYGLMYSSIGDRENLCFLKDLIQLELNENTNEVLRIDSSIEEDKENENPSKSSSEVKQSLSNSSYSQFFSLKPFYQPILNNRRINKSSNSELNTCSIIFQNIESDFELIAKRLIQDIVMGTSEEFERLVGTLKVSKWTMPIFKYFITLMHDAPHNIKQITLNLILSKWEDNINGDENYIQISEYLVANRFNYEIFNLKKNLMKKYGGLDSRNQDRFKCIWSNYLDSVAESCNYVLLDELLLSAFEIGMDVKPYVRNKWEKLPMLKSEWERLNIKLYMDENLLSIDKAAVLSEEESDITLNSSSPLRTSPPSESPIVPDKKKESETPLKTPSKIKGKPVRKPKAVSKKKVTKKTPTTQGNTSKTDVTPSAFDIHSFTAMLTAKLSTPTSNKEKEPQVKQVETKAVDRNGSQRSDNLLKEMNVKENRRGMDVTDNSITDMNKEIRIQSSEYTGGIEDANDSSNSKVSESLEDFQANSLEFDDNFDYEMFVKEEFNKEKSPELEGTMADKNLLDNLEEESQETPEDIKLTKNLDMPLIENREDEAEADLGATRKRSYLHEMEESPLKKKEKKNSTKIIDSKLEGETESVLEVSSSVSKEHPDELPQANEIISSLDDTEGSQSNGQSLKDRDGISTVVAQVPALKKENSVVTFSNFIKCISDEDIACLSSEESFKIETDILEFMIRMRNIRRQKS
ncbi:hypothetical protein CLIB1423_01S03884 [[Candida] railenensis]|uniref:Telomere-associated protein Rif1 N-terminal domain-containing protein n=1 Tax=[Candida] railenensis TaxID=45579 RepID=A0A9P0VVK1_9ASCO|nr:hypothetical protein CLIB1423_01S03884 [[Candida] railenensis]